VLEEGNRDDWFNSPTILRLSILSGVSLAAMLWWELSPRNEHPVVDFRVLKNRQLAASIFLFVALGFGLYGGTFLFPLFTQTLLGFTPTETGLTMMPGGLFTAATALVCGAMLNGKKPLVDARILIALGVSFFVLAMWDLGHLTTAAGEADARLPLMVRGVALGLLFTPINNAAYGALKPSEAQQASGLINLSRQLGGSFGIAILGTYLTTHVQQHRVDLLAYINPYNPAFVQRLQLVTAGISARGVPEALANQTAMKMIEGMVMRQATMLAYNDAWMLILLSFLATAPAILFLRKPSAPAAGVDMH
jgi:DHA2 family multidrug resistance protein